MLLIGDAMDLITLEAEVGLRKIGETNLSARVNIEALPEPTESQKEHYDFIIIKTAAGFKLEKAAQGIPLGDYDIEGIVDQIAAQAASAGTGV